MTTQSSTPRYNWWGWQTEVENENDDDRKDVWYLTITDGGEEMAVIIHRTCPQPDGTHKYPIDGPLADEKYRQCQTIVAALNAYQAESGWTHTDGKPASGPCDTDCKECP